MKLLPAGSLAVGAAALVLAAPAGAALDRYIELPAVTITDSFQIATAFWGATPAACAAEGRTAPHSWLASQADLDAPQPGQPPLAPGASVLMRSAMPGCDVWLPLQSFKDPAARVQRCGDLVHEYGHALDIGHSPDHGSVMYPESRPDYVVQACFMRFWRAGTAAWARRFGPLHWLHR